MSLRAPASVFRQEDAGAWQSPRQDNRIDRKIKFQFPATEAKIDKIKMKKRRKKDKKIKKIGVFDGNFEKWGGW